MFSVADAYQIAHIVMDGVLLLLLIYLIRKKDGNSGAISDEVLSQLEKTIEHTGEINKQFETALAERKIIIEKLVGELDKKISRATRVLARLEQNSNYELLDVNPGREMSFAGNTTKKILEKLDQGLSIDEICSRYKKPKGEVELIAKLYSQGKSHSTPEINTASKPS